MNYRVARLEDAVSLSTAGTKTIDVDFKDPCSRLVFDLSYKNPAAIGSGFLDHPAAMLEKVELVDGSDVFVSLTGKELLAMMAYENRKGFYDMNYGVFNSTSRLTLNLDFGRYLWDREMALNPAHFTNPNIKLEWDMAKLHADEQTLTYNLDAYLFDERAVAPAGMLMRKRIEEWTPSQNAHKYVTMPTDYVYRTMWLVGTGTNAAGTQPRGIPSSIASFKLSEDQDKRIPIDMDMREYLRQLEIEIGFFRERFQCSTSGGLQFYVLPSEQMKATATSSGAEMVGTTVTEGNMLKIETSAAGSHTVYGEAQGQAPLNMAGVFFGDQMDPDDWYDVTKIGTLKLDVQAKNEVVYSAKGYLLLTQLRPY